MPMCRNLGSISAPKAHHEWRPFGAWVASHRGKLASLKDRRPLQIAEVHNLGRCGALFFLLAVNPCCNYRKAEQRGIYTRHQFLFHRISFARMGQQPAQKILFPRPSGNMHNCFYVSNHPAAGAELIENKLRRPGTHWVSRAGALSLWTL